MGQGEEESCGRGQEREGEIKGERESKRIEERNRHSNYRSRNEGLMTKNGAEENKEQDEEEAKRYSKRQQFTEQMEQLCGPNYSEREVWSIRGRRKQRETKRAEESRWRSGSKKEQM